jgi:twitching motility protein PilI
MNAAASELAALGGQPYELLYALERRLRAARLDFAAGAAQAWSGLGFRLRDWWLVTPRADVREIITPPPTTRVPGAKAFVLGIANVRGSLLPVNDLAQLLGLPREPEHREQRVLVFNSERVPVGFLVDEVAGNRQFAPADQRPEWVADSGPLRPYLLGAFAREGRRWLALSLHKLVRSPEFLNAGA